MIIYGDPSYQADPAALLECVRGAVQGPGAGSPLDWLRTLLIQAGQLEQAGQEGLSRHAAPEEARRRIAGFEALTDAAAAAFCACLSAADPAFPAGTADQPLALSRMQGALEQLLTTREAPLTGTLTVKLPEGFAFYTLYPERSCAAAHRWMAEHPGVRRVLVVGIRSIGTSLSAVVAATLAASGRQVRRLTVRPTGHPFHRYVEICDGDLEGIEAALVVDEGPGLSGSSMAAVADALTRAGMAGPAVSFLPAHPGLPGAAATDPVRSCWDRTPRYVVPLSDLRWGGRSLPEALAASTPDVCPGCGPVEWVRDLSGGLWRGAVFGEACEWPAVTAPFERTKYLCSTRHGDRVLWKFAGLAVMPDGSSGAEAALALQAARADAGWSPAPLGTAWGFVAQRWEHGVPLRKQDGTPDVLAYVGRYVAEVAGPALPAGEQGPALARLGEMLCWNASQSLGETAAARAREWTGAAASAAERCPRVPRYGDGRLAPHEWLRILKAGCSRRTPRPMTWTTASSAGSPRHGTWPAR